MTVWSAIFRVLAVLAVVGLVTGVPALAATHAAGMAVAMADDMPPCDQDDCGDMASCPYATVCYAPCPARVPAAAAIVVPMGIKVATLPPNEGAMDGLPLLPPTPPPRA